jgi:hypothetical protein
LFANLKINRLTENKAKKFGIYQDCFNGRTKAQEIDFVEILKNNRPDDKTKLEILKFGLWFLRAKSKKKSIDELR